jgi:hypothetical protein
MALPPDHCLTTAGGQTIGLMPAVAEILRSAEMLNADVLRGNNLT